MAKAAPLLPASTSEVRKAKDRCSVVATLEMDCSSTALAGLNWHSCDADDQTEC